MRWTGMMGLALAGLVACEAEPVTEPDAASDVGADVTADASGDTQIDPGPELPAPSTLDFNVLEPGPYNVGYRTWDHTYTVPGTGQERTIGLHVWYPTHDEDGDGAAYIGLFNDYDSFVDATVADPVNGTSYPVLVHSHGHQAFGGSSAMLKRHLARHGWVSISPDHVGDMLGANETSETVAHYIERPSDITASLDALAALPDSDPLSRADTSRVVLSGHSRGAYTVWSSTGSTYDMTATAQHRPDATQAELDAFAAGFDDPRIVAAIPMAGAYRPQWFGDTGFTSIDVRVLVLSGDADNPDSMQGQWDLMAAVDPAPFPMTWVELAGGCHETFGLGHCDQLDVATSDPVIGIYGLALGRATVLGDDDATTLGILDGTVEVAADIVRLEVR